VNPNPPRSHFYAALPAAARLAAMLAAALVATLAAAPLRALDPAATLTQLLHRQWDVVHGLPHASVRSLAQSPDGYLWVGTQSGLARFDGIGFEPVADDKGEILKDQIESLAVDRRGVLWIGTYGGGLLRLEQGRLRRFGRDDGLTVPEILELAIDERGDLWVGTHGGGVLRFADGRLQVMVPAGKLPDPVVTGLIFGAGGELHLVSQTAVQVYRDGLPQSVPSGFPGLRIRGAATRSAGGLWLATDHGLLAWDGERFSAPFPGRGPRRALSVAEDRDGNLFLGSYDGLSRFSPDGREARFAAPHPEADSVILKLFEDRAGAIWIGTLGGGLRQLAAGELRTWGLEEGLASGLVTSVAEDLRGRLLVTTRNSGLSVFAGAAAGEGRFAKVRGLPDEDLWTSYVDPKNGDLWIGTSGAGLLRQRGGGAGAVSTYSWERWGHAEGLGSGAVFTVLGTKDGAIWAGTNGGLSRLLNGRVENFTIRDGLAANEVRALAEDRQGRLWVGTNGGLSLLEENGRFRSFGPADLFPAAGVAAIREDPLGDALWLGTLGAGLMHFRFASGELFRFQATDGLVSDDIGFLLADSTGHLWLGTSSGLVRVALAELEAHIADPGAPLHTWIFDRRHGLRGTVWVQSPGACATRDGRLFFATRGGLVEVDPRRLAVQPSPPVSAALAESAALPWRPAAPLSPPSARLGFVFSAPFGHVPEAFRLRYRLQGFDPEWRVARTERARTYQSVPPGRYTFEVETSDEEGRYSGKPLAIPVEVEARLAGPLVFAGAALALLTLGFVLFQKIRLRIFQRRERELERQVERALAELKVLRGMLPICSLCKKIRDDEGYWEDLGAYVTAHSGVAFTASFCPDCDRKHRDHRASSEKVARLVKAVPGGGK
jgi:ligand-binding sensor domain-containing protein